MDLFSDARIIIPVVILFAILVIWANRCSNCGKWFGIKVRSRVKTGESDSQELVETNKKTHEHRWKSVHRYNYDEERVCTRCRTVTKSSCSSKSPEATGYFPVSFEGESATESQHAKEFAAESGPPWWHPSHLFHDLTWKKYILWFFIVLIMGFIANDPDVLRYPGSFQSYLERYADFLTDPFGSHVFKAYVTVSGGSWKRSILIERLELVRENDWLEKVPKGARIISQASREREMPSESRYFKYPVKMELATWTQYEIESWKNFEERVLQGSDSNPIWPEFQETAKGETNLGSLRKSRETQVFELFFKDSKTGSIYHDDSLIIYRNSDRQYSTRYFGEKWYLHFLNSPNLYKSLITLYPSGGAYIRLFVPSDEFETLDN